MRIDKILVAAVAAVVVGFGLVIGGCQGGRIDAGALQDRIGEVETFASAKEAEVAKLEQELAEAADQLAAAVEAELPEVAADIRKKIVQVRSVLDQKAVVAEQARAIVADLQAELDRIEAEGDNADGETLASLAALSQAAGGAVTPIYPPAGAALALVGAALAGVSNWSKQGNIRKIVSAFEAAKKANGGVIDFNDEKVRDQIKTVMGPSARAEVNKVRPAI